MGEYDFEPRKAPSAFLSLKEKGDKILIRIASSPYREPKIWKIDTKPPMDPEKMLKLTEDQWMTIYREPDFNVTEAFSWKVIDRETGTAKIFTGTPGVYNSIKEYAEMKEWGDPTTYDLTIERTETPGKSYYKVIALPNKDELTTKEEELIDALDLQEKLPAARKLSEKQVDYVPEEDEDEPDQTPEEPIEEPSKVDDLGGEPINIDDIPF